MTRATVAFLAELRVGRELHRRVPPGGYHGSGRLGRSAPRDGVDVNLAGHTLIGDRFTGIVNSGGFEGVHIRNGTMLAQSTGVRLTGATGNVVPAVKFSTRSEALIIEGGGSNGATLSNKIEKVGGDGIHVNAAASETLIRGNQSNHSADDGIDVRDPTARLGDNVTYSNTDLGIEAVPGVIDLGGNMASGNGNPLQCQNVFCQ